MVQSIADYAKKNKLRPTDRLELSWQIMYQLMTNQLISSKDISNQQHITQQPTYNKFKQGFTALMLKNLPIWMDILDHQFNDPIYDNNIKVMHFNKLIDTKQMQKDLNSAAQRVMTQLTIPQKRWDRSLRRPYRKISKKYFVQDIDIIPTHDKVKREYNKSTKWIISNQLFAASTMDLQHASIELLPGKHVSMINIILLQLATPTIFNKMQLLDIYERAPLFRDRGKIITQEEMTYYANPANVRIKKIAYNVCQIKTAHDAFALGNGKNIELATMTNVSIPFMASTPHNCDVVAAQDIGKEGRKSLFQFVQNPGIEALLLQTVGCFHPITNQIINVQVTSPADTHASQFGMASSSFAGRSGHLYTTATKNEVFDICNVVPLSRTAANVSELWENIIKDVWTPELEEWIQQKYPNDEINQYNVWAKCCQDGYSSLKAKLNTKTDLFSIILSPWLAASSVYGKGIDGLHSILNLPTLTTKYIILFAYDEYGEMKQNDPNKISEQQIDHHIKHCIRIKSSFPKQNRQRGGVKLFGNNVRLLISNWNHLMLLVECDCGYQPFVNSPLRIVYFSVNVMRICTTKQKKI